MELPPHLQALALAGAVFAVGFTAAAVDAVASAHSPPQAAARSPVQAASRAVYQTVVLMVLCLLLWGGASAALWAARQRGEDAGLVGRLLGFLA